MVRIDFDHWGAQSKVLRARGNPENAAELLRLIASQLSAGTPLPEPFAQYLAGAIEVAMHEPAAHRGTALARKLHLTAASGRPKKGLDEYRVGRLYHRLRRRRVTSEVVYEVLGKRFKASESTLKRAVEAYDYDTWGWRRELMDELTDK